MRTALILALLTVPAFASAEDDYVACLIGQAAVALHNQSAKDAASAQEIAYDLCGEMVDGVSIPEQEREGLGDYVNLMVERMAAE